jgi:hypothetical protein
MTATVKREVQVNLPASLTMSMVQTWLRPRRPQVIGVDLLAHALVLLNVEAHDCTHATQGFGKRHRGAPVKQPIGLPGSFIDGHGAANEILAALGESDSDVFDQRSHMDGIHFLHGS